MRGSAENYLILGEFNILDLNYLLTIAFFSFFGISFTQTTNDFWAIGNGDWDANVWSHTQGGPTCNCAPTHGDGTDAFNQTQWAQNVYIPSGFKITQNDEMWFLGMLYIFEGGEYEMSNNKKFTLALHHPSAANNTAQLNAGYGDIQFETNPKDSSVFGIVPSTGPGSNTSGLADNIFGRVHNYGSWTIDHEINSDGYFNNEITGEVFCEKLHSDWYTCNAGTITASVEIKMHGGMTDCCGDMILLDDADKLKFEEQTNNKGFTYFTETSDGAYYYATGSWSPFGHNGSASSSTAGFETNTGTWNPLDLSSVQPTNNWGTSLGNSIVSCQNYCLANGQYPTDIKPDIGTPPDYSQFFNPGFDPEALYIDNFAYNGQIVEPVTFCSSGILPIELVDFYVYKLDQTRAEIKWSTVSEYNNDYFTVMRSLDGHLWEDVASVKGAGNSTEQLDYSIVDNISHYGVVYYRLKQTDFDGKFELFDVRAINFDGASKGLVLYPNPANSTLELYSDQDMNGSIEVYNALGKVVTSMVHVASVSNRRIELNVSDLESGFYIIKVSGKTKRFIKR
ncbi:MAG: T9SS type A sorting domain-containing protein [Crocinitomicaceae bacterium]|nr:T9SS type A sorting domain-containing protein [Crocinitomicaceae bacterium]